MSNFKELVRVGKDAVTRFTQNGKAVTGFSAAFDNGWGDKKQTVWLDCSAWGERYQKVAEYITKGKQLVVEGNIGTREHEGKTYITLDVTDIKLCDGKRDGEQPKRQDAPRQSNSPPPESGGFEDDDIPF